MIWLTLSCAFLTEIICQFLIACFKVCMSKISDNKTVKFLFLYSNLFGGALFMQSRCTDPDSAEFKWAYPNLSLLRHKLDNFLVQVHFSMSYIAALSEYADDWLYFHQF